MSSPVLSNPRASALHRGRSRVLRALAITAAIAFVGVWVIGAILASRAQLAQRIEPHEPAMAILLAEPGVPIGEPQQYIVFDDKAFLEGTAQGGSRLLNEKYLRETNQYPWQLKTVEFLRNLVAIATGVAAVVLLVLSRWLTRRTS